MQKPTQNHITTKKANLFTKLIYSVTLAHIRLIRRYSETIICRYSETIIRRYSETIVLIQRQSSESKDNRSNLATITLTHPGNCSKLVKIGQSH